MNNFKTIEIKIILGNSPYEVCKKIKAILYSINDKTTKISLKYDLKDIQQINTPFILTGSIQSKLCNKDNYIHFEKKIYNIYEKYLDNNLFNIEFYIICLIPDTLNKDIIEKYNTAATNINKFTVLYNLKFKHSFFKKLFNKW